MNLTDMQLKITKALLSLSVIVLAMSACFLSGITQGQNNINVLWQAEKLKTSSQLAYLQGQIKQQESGHRLETARISDQLRKTEDDYAKATYDLAAERANRLRLSAERATAYARLAEGGPTECRGLASYAARLDGSLEEGRGLVGELQAALGRSDDQLRLLGAQIVNDRKLLGDR